MVGRDREATKRPLCLTLVSMLGPVCGCEGNSAAVLAVPLLLALLASCPGCATLPNASETILYASLNEEPVRIASAEGFLSPAESQALLARLEQSDDPKNVLQRLVAVMEHMGGGSLSKGNKAVLLGDVPSAQAALLQAVEGARDHVNLETFQFEDDGFGNRLADLLLRKQKAGVPVNLIYDSVGSFHTPRAFFKRLADGGIRVVEFNPVNPVRMHGTGGVTDRNHSKVLVVDGKVAITGGVNIRSLYSPVRSDEGPDRQARILWRDTDVQIEGPAVAEIQRLFLDTWQRQKGPELPKRDYFPSPKEQGDDLVRIVASTPGSKNRTAFVMYEAAFIFAASSIHLANAYFVPDEQTRRAIAHAAGRGVDVKIILPEVSDHPWVLYSGRYHYSELLRAGVKLYERRHAVLHAKTAVIDGVWSTVGSTNLDSWSLLRDDEVNAIILSRGFAADMERMFAGDLAASEEVRLEDWERRPVFSRIREWFAHLFSPWL